MEYGLISHRAALNECYALDKDHLEIEIKTGYEVTEVAALLWRSFFRRYPRRS
ncbi:MAG: hypothetical protein V8S31_08260 [Lachnospiraceae bacterium]